MSFVHYVPDPAVVPCLGCNELVREQDLVKHGHHMGRSTFFWHPYHFWCLRESPPRPNPEPTCADCGGPLMLEQMQSVIRWGMTFEKRLMQRSIVATGQPIAFDDPDAAVPRPPGLRLVAVSRMLKRVPLVFEKLHRVLDDDEVVAEDYVRHQFEMVHDTCPDDEPQQWRTQLRGTADDADLREVYADWLEQQGERVRAEFARLVVARHRGTAPTSELRALRGELPGSWMKDVVGAL